MINNRNKMNMECLKIKHFNKGITKSKDVLKERNKRVKNILKNPLIYLMNLINNKIMIYLK